MASTKRTRVRRKGSSAYVVTVVYPNGYEYGVELSSDEAYDFANNVLAVLHGLRT